MEKDIAKKPTLRLSNTVTRRTVPMTARGCDMLRAIRNFKQNELLEEHDVEYDIPFPTVFHMILSDYCEMKKIEVEENVSDSGQEA